MRIQQLPNFQTGRLTASKGGKESPIGDVIDQLTLSPMTIGTDLLDASMGLGYATNSFPQTFQAAGYAVGAAHGAMAIGYVFGSMDQSHEVSHSRLGKATGHALLAAGHIAGAAGAGVWALAPLAGGMLITTLQDYRDRT
ncbi:hypothetical protein JST97_36645 [bacterium]|nr:hypothetical protein [bacterium]